MFLQLSPHQQIKFLIRAAQLDVRLQGDRVVTLHQGIDELMDRDRLIAFITFGKIVALQHLRDRMRGRQPDQIDRAELIHPSRVEHDLGLVRVQHFEYLLAIALRISQHLLARQGRARGVLARRVAYHAGKIADQKQRVMTQILQLAHLIQQHRMPQMQIGRGRIEARFDAQRACLRQLFDQLGFYEQLIGSALDDSQSCLLWCFVHISNFNLRPDNHYRLSEKSYRSSALNRHSKASSAAHLPGFEGQRLSVKVRA